MMRGLGALVTAGGLLAIGPAIGPAIGAPPVATVMSATAPADVRQAGAWKGASSGDLLGAGDAARTGLQGHAIVRDDGGTIVELYPLTLLEIPAANSFNTLAGRIWATFRKIPGLSREIRTPSATAIIRGTTLAIDSTAAGTRLTVLEGLVEIRDNHGKRALVPDGHSVSARSDGLGPVERALADDLEEGRRFLERSHGWMVPGAVGPHGAAGMAPAGPMRMDGDAAGRHRGTGDMAGHGPSSRRPSAMERSEGAWDRERGALPHGAHHGEQPVSGTAGPVPENAVHSRPNSMPGEMPGEMPGRMPGEMPNAMPGELPGTGNGRPEVHRGMPAYMGNGQGHGANLHPGP